MHSRVKVKACKRIGTHKIDGIWHVERFEIIFGCTGHCQRQRQSLESEAAYIHVLSCTIMDYHVLPCTIMYYHELLSVPGKKIPAYSAKQATEKKILEQNCFLALPPRHWQAWDKLHAGLPNQQIHI